MKLVMQRAHRNANTILLALALVTFLLLVAMLIFGCSRSVLTPAAPSPPSPSPVTLTWQPATTRDTDPCAPYKACILQQMVTCSGADPVMLDATAEKTTIALPQGQATCTLDDILTVRDTIGDKVRIIQHDAVVAANISPGPQTVALRLRTQ